MPVELDPAREEEGRQKAAAFRQEHGLGLGPIRDVADVAESVFGADVALISMPPFLDSVVFRDTETQAVLIALGTTENPERQRFSVAHELGHLVFEELSTVVHASETTDRAPELRAHAFARHFLLPEGALALLLEEIGAAAPLTDERVLSEIVSLFEVSATVAAIQLRQQDLISDSTFELWQRVEASYLARRYGWAAERQTRLLEASTERPSKRMLANATEAYIANFLSLPTLALINGATAPEDLRVALEAHGISPYVAPPASLDLDDLGDFGQSE